jgi:hypothetical protein
MATLSLEQAEIVAAGGAYDEDADAYVLPEEYLRTHGLAIETKRRPGVETTIYHESPELHHRVGALNMAQEGAIRRHLDRLDRAHDQGDIAAARAHASRLRSYLDGLAAPDAEDADDEEEPSTPRRRSSSSRRQPAIAPEPPPGDESKKLLERVRRLGWDRSETALPRGYA